MRESISVYAGGSGVPGGATWSLGPRLNICFFTPMGNPQAVDELGEYFCPSLHYCKKVQLSNAIVAAVCDECLERMMMLPPPTRRALFQENVPILPRLLSHAG